ncbi:hypothetical protein H8356DRAFT_1088937 [Neocallimastix lanati (nom. inval.)]|nr:hypothetical protein H8356DRAFT_1088937 [Neocallimastix sp. JGI-2020a]
MSKSVLTSAYLEKQRKFVALIKEIQTSLNSKEYKNQGYTFNEYIKMKWNISQAQAYRYLRCGKVLDQLEEFEIKPSYERLCKELSNVAKTPAQMKILWNAIIKKTGGRPDCVNSTHVNNIWKEICSDKKYSNILISKSILQTPSVSNNSIQNIQTISNNSLNGSNSLISNNSIGSNTSSLSSNPNGSISSMSSIIPNTTISNIPVIFNSISNISPPITECSSCISSSLSNNLITTIPVVSNSHFTTSFSSSPIYNTSVMPHILTNSYVTSNSPISNIPIGPNNSISNVSVIPNSYPNSSIVPNSENNITVVKNPLINIPVMECYVTNGLELQNFINNNDHQNNLHASLSLQQQQQSFQSQQKQKQQIKYYQKSHQTFY